MHYRLAQNDLTLILAISRGTTLSRAADLLAQDTSSVHRALGRLERRLGQALFDRGRWGCRPLPAALPLIHAAEVAEDALLEAQARMASSEGPPSGLARLSTTDAVLEGLLLPLLSDLLQRYPQIQLELSTDNAFLNLSRHEADLALRLTACPPTQLVGRRLRQVHYRLCATPGYLETAGRDSSRWRWIAPDDLLPDHPSVLWRRRHHPGIQPDVRCDTILGVARLVRAGLGVALLPDFLIDPAWPVLAIPQDLPPAELWLLMRPGCRALRPVRTLYQVLGDALVSA
ncbi:MAG: LysR family transcriptional regulator [Pseudomonas oryzihabitans]